MVNLSPTEESFQESLCSLRLAKQINQCELGKPKRQLKDSVDTPTIERTQSCPSVVKTDKVSDKAEPSLSASLGAASRKQLTSSSTKMSVNIKTPTSKKMKTEK